MTETTAATKQLTDNPKLIAWVEEIAALTQPDAIHWCDGSAEEYDRLCQELVDAGTFERLSDAKRPNSYLAPLRPRRRRPRRGPHLHLLRARGGRRPDQQLARPGRDARASCASCSSGSMQGRTMYVVPVLDGPARLADRPHRRPAHRLALRRGLDADHDPDGRGRARRARRRRRLRPVRALGRHAAGRRPGRTSRGRATRTTSTSSTSPRRREIWSYGSGYGGNALLGKKCFALRIASAMARDEGWMAEHMLILKLTSPEGEVKYVTGAFPSACGKTNLAMLIPTLEGWTVETVGDDIAWMKFGEDGRLYAINPEAGFFGVAPGTEPQDEPERDGHDRAQLDLHQLRAHRRRRRLVGGDDRRAAGPRDRLAGQRLDAGVRRPRGAPERPLHRPGGAVPVDRARVGGPGRRADRRVPVRRPPRDRRAARHARRSTGSTASSSARRCRSETTAAAAGEVGQLRFDPMAMLPFCGYNMADYFEHWLKIGAARDADQMPRIFYVNWFRKDDDGKFLWPGFGENSRVLEWVFRRCNGEGETVETPIGLVPADGRPRHRRPRHLRRGDGRAAHRRRRAGQGAAAPGRGSTSPSSATSSRPRSASSSTR